MARLFEKCVESKGKRVPRKQHTEHCTGTPVVGSGLQLQSSVRRNKATCSDGMGKH